MKSFFIRFTFNNVSALSSFLQLLNNFNALLLNSENYSFIKVINTFNPSIADTTITNFIHIQSIGQGLYTYGASLLILCSVILLLAMTAPIFISRRSKLNI